MKTLCVPFYAGNENSEVQAVSSLSSAGYASDLLDVAQIIHRLTEEGKLINGKVYAIFVGDEESKPSRKIMYQENLNDGLILYVIK